MTLVPKGVIVLCHGFLGFEQFGPITYFRGVAESLTALGCKVISPQVPRTGSIEERAKKLNMEIIGLLNIRPGTIVNVHLIGHSMGGLDIRRLVYLDEYINGIKGSKYRVCSITTISTPHRGSPIAEWPNTLGPVSRIPCKFLLNMIGGSGQAMDDMRPRNMAKFNDIYKDKSNIKYYSVMSKFTPSILHFMYPTYRYIRKSEGRDSRLYPEAYGPNDGLVSVQSAIWGDFLDIVDSDTSHVGIVGWGITGILTGDRIYDTDKLFTALVENIAKNVED